MPDQPAACILVIGYGNTLRRDDALGPLIADEVERWHCPGVRCLSLAQLTTDMAADLAVAEQVYFVDARRCSPAEAIDVRAEPVLPGETLGVALVHAISPQAVLNLCLLLYGCRPQAALISVPGLDFSFGEGLSGLALHGKQQALGMMARLFMQRDGGEPVELRSCPRSVAARSSSSYRENRT